MNELEFSRIININKVHKQDENAYTYTADNNELKIIADRLNIVGLKSLHAEVVAKIYKKDNLLVSGLIKSDVIQESVISLADVEEHVETEFSIIYAYEDLEKDESLMNIDKNLELEIMDNTGNCEVGEVIVQELSLSLNSFPKTKEDQKFEVFTYGDEIPKEATKNPFAVLKDLKNKE